MAPGCHCRVQWTWCLPLLGAIVVWYGGGRGGWQPTLVEWTWCLLVCYGWGGVGVVPLLGGIAGCEGRVTANFECAMVGGEGNDQLWRSGCGAIAVPLQGADLCFISSFYIQGHQFHPDTQENNSEFCSELLADVTLFSTLIEQKLFFAIWGLCWYNSWLGHAFALISPITWQAIQRFRFNFPWTSKL